MMPTSVKIVKDSAKVLTAEMSCNIFSVFYFVAITWIFAKVELASLSILGVITGLGVMVTGLGVNPALLKQIPRLIGENDKRTASAMFKSEVLLHSALAIAVSYAICKYSKLVSLIFFKTADYSYLIRIISVNVVAYKLLEDGEQLLTALQAFGKYSWVRIFQGIVARSVALIGYFVGGIGTYIAIIIAFQFVLFCFIVFLSRDFIKIRSGLYPIRQLVVYSFPFYGNAYANFAVQQGDQFLIGVFLNPGQLAGYYVARRFFDHLSTITDAILRPVAVKLAELKAYGVESVERAIYRASRYLFFVVVPISCLVAVSCYALLEIYGGKKYIDAFPVLAILSLSLIPSALYTLTVSGVYVIGEPKETLKCEVVRGVTNIFLCLVLINLFGVIGISSAQFVTYLVASSFAYYLLRKLSKAKPDWGVLRDTVLVSLIASTPVVGLQILYYHILVMPFYLLLGLVLFGFLFRGNLTDEDVKLIEGILPRKCKLLTLSFITGKKKFAG